MEFKTVLSVYLELIILVIVEAGSGEEHYKPTVQVQQEREAYMDYEDCVKEKAWQFTKGREKPALVLVQEGDTALLRCRIWFVSC